MNVKFNKIPSAVLKLFQAYQRMDGQSDFNRRSIGMWTHLKLKK